MAIVSEYASRTPAETAFIEMLADYERGLPDAETLFDPARCPAAFLPYLAEAYYADTYMEGLGEAYQRAAIASSARINAIRGSWGAAAQVCADVGALEPAAEYIRGPGTVFNARLTSAGAGRIGNVHYGALTPRNVKLPGGVNLVAFRIDAGDNTIGLIGDKTLDEADWGDGDYALQIAPAIERAVIVLTRTATTDRFGLMTFSGNAVTIRMRGFPMGRLRTAAGSGSEAQVEIRPGKLAGASIPGSWQGRVAAWTYDAPLRNIGLNVVIFPGRGGQAGAEYQQAMAYALNRVLPYRISAPDVRLGTVFEAQIGTELVAPAGVISYQGYEA